MIQYFTYTIRYGDKQYITYDVDAAEARIDSIKGVDLHDVTVTTTKGDAVIEECSAYDFMGLGF